MSDSKGKGKSVKKKDGKSRSSRNAHASQVAEHSATPANMSPLLGRASKPVVAQLNDEELREIQRLLDMIPKRFHDPEFNVLKEVVEILTSKEKRKRMAKIEKECAMLDKAMSTFVNVHYEGFIQSINSYTHILQAVSVNKKEVSNLKHVIKKCRDLLVQRSATHLPALWNVRSQCSEMISLLDCIAWLKNVPNWLSSFLKGDRLEAFAASQTESKATLLIAQGLDSRVTSTLDFRAVTKKSRGPHFLHAGLLLLSAATLLTAKKPQLMDNGGSEAEELFVVETTARALDHATVQSDALESPLARIPALRRLRETIISQYLNLQESLLEELQYTVYRHRPSLEQETTDGIEAQWPSASAIYGVEDDEPEQERHPTMEAISEKLDIDYRLNVAKYIALLTEALVALGRLDEAAEHIASRAIVEFRAVMSERLSWVTSGVEDGSLEIECSQGVRTDVRNTVEEAIALHLRGGYVGESASSRLQELFERDRSTTTERVLVVFLRSVFGHFLDILKKQLFLSEVFKLRKREEEEVEIQSGTDVVARVYHFGSGEGADLLGRVQFRPTEMWELIQMELISFLRVQLQKDSQEEEELSGFEARASAAEVVNERPGSGQSSTSFSAFRFSSSSAFIHAEVEDHDDVASLFAATPYNVVRVYLPVLYFNTAAVELLTTEANTSWTLKEFLEQFISTKFMHRLGQDFAKSSSEAVSSPSRWHVVYPRCVVGERLSTTKIPVLKCADATIELLSVLFDYILELPNFSASLVDVVLAAVGSFLQTVSAKVYGVLNNTLTGKLLDDKSVERLLHADPNLAPVLRCQSRSVATSDESISFTKENEKLEDSFHDPEFRDGHLVDDMKSLRLLAHLNSSMDWMMLFIELMSTKVDDFITVKHKECPLVYQEVPSTWQQLQPMVKELERLSLKCLFALRLEVRQRSVRGIAHMEECLYMLRDKNEQPDPFVYTLVEELSTLESTLANSVTKTKMAYIFGSLAPLICSEFVYSLRRLDGISENGILKVRKNIFALQQLLPTSIVHGQESLFDRVRVYYELLKLDPREILAHAQNSLSQHDTFSLDEYEQLSKKLCAFNCFEGTNRRTQQKQARAQATKLMSAISEVLAHVKR